MTVNVTYLQAISELFPECICSCEGPGTNYESLVHESGPPIPSEAVLTAAILTLTKLKVWLAIQEERERRKFSGLKVGDYWFHTDTNSRIQFLGLVLVGASMPTGIMWKTMTKEFVEMTPSLAISVFQGVVTQDILIFSKAEAHKAAMEASSSPGTYDFISPNPTITWPQAFTDVYPNVDLAL